jgi:hypothetical protein
VATVVTIIKIMGVILKMVTAGQGEQRSTELMRLEVMVGPLIRVFPLETLSTATGVTVVLLKGRFPVLREEMAVTLI